MYLMTGSSYVLQHHSNAGLAKKKADIVKELSFLLILLSVIYSQFVFHFSNNLHLDLLDLTYTNFGHCELKVNCEYKQVFIIRK